MWRSNGNADSDIVPVLFANVSNSATALAALPSTRIAYTLRRSPAFGSEPAPRETPAPDEGVNTRTSSFPSLSGPCHRLCSTAVHGALFRSPTSPSARLESSLGVFPATQRSPRAYALDPRRSAWSLR